MKQYDVIIIGFGIICSNNFLVFSIACFRLLFRESSCNLKTRLVSVCLLYTSRCV